MPAGQIFRATLLFAALGVSTAAIAQTTVNPGLAANGAPRPGIAPSGDPAEALARYLRVLASDPRNLEALTGAGHAALQIGDANAALAFYARAEEIAPRNGRAKAGLGSALLQLQKPGEAIRLFDDAVDLGIPEADVASDRGLALDLRGENKRAQKAYAAALGAYGDDETKRRMALSMAITGDRDGATQLLDPLLRRNDRGAWRARAFILAMGGDIAGAEVVARSAMSASQVSALRPFLVRLAALKPAEKALAVNFGEMPSTGRSYRPSDLAALQGPSPAPQRASPGAGLIPDGNPFGPSSPVASPSAAPPAKVAAASRRRRSAPAVAGLDASARGGNVPATSTVAPTPKSTPLPTPVAPRPVVVATAPRVPTPTPSSSPAPFAAPRPTTPEPAAPSATRAPATAPAAPPSALSPATTRLPATASAAPPLTTRYAVPPPATTPATSPSATPPVAPPSATPPAAPASATMPAVPTPSTTPAAPSYAMAPASSPPPATTPPAVKPPVSPLPVTKPAAPPAKPAHAAAPRASSFALDPSITARARAEEAKRVETASKNAEKPAPDAAPTKAAPKSNTKSKTPPGAVANAEERKPKADPARVWVQVAGGASVADLPKTWARLKPKAPPLAKDQDAWTTPLRATNRLLVGPFETEDEAQAYVNRMSKAGLSGFTFTSEKGQDIAKLSAARK